VDTADRVDREPPVFDGDIEDARQNAVGADHRRSRTRRADARNPGLDFAVADLTDRSAAPHGLDVDAPRDLRQRRVAHPAEGIGDRLLDAL